MCSLKKILLLACGFILMEIAFAYAQTVYIIDEFEVTMRTGPSIGNKIIAMLSTGTKLQVLGDAPEWMRVKNPADDKEGWILKRYASAEIPKKIILEQLRHKYQAASEQLEIETEKSLSFKKENNELRNALNSSKQNFENLNKKYSALITESKDFLSLKNEHASNLENLRTATSELIKLKEENEDLRLSVNLIWFLSGAGIVVASWLAGFIMGKVRKRSRSLYG